MFKKNENEIEELKKEIFFIKNDIKNISDTCTYITNNLLYCSPLYKKMNNIYWKSRGIELSSEIDNYNIISRFRYFGEDDYFYAICIRDNTNNKNCTTIRIYPKTIKLVNNSLSLSAIDIHDIVLKFIDENKKNIMCKNSVQEELNNLFL